MNIFAASFETVTGLPEIIGFIFIFAFGAIVGSFLNVVIHRVPLEESIVYPNSACPKCGQPIKPYDNLPIISWLALGGKCRNCKEKISARYPLVELLTAVLFVLTFWQIGFNLFLPVALVFMAAMIALTGCMPRNLRTSGPKKRSARDSKSVSSNSSGCNNRPRGAN